MDALGKLKNKRDKIKSQLARFSKFVDDIEDSKIVELQARLDRIEFSFNEFNNVQCEIELLDNGDDISSERENFEDAYYSALAAGRSKVMAYHNRIKVFSNNQQAQGVISQASDASSVKLPILNLPKFYGDYDRWTQFRETFQAFKLVDMPFLVLDKITSNIPVTSFDSTRIQIPENITLADPYFNISSPIDILLGASIFYEVLCVGQIKLGTGQPILQKSVLGWIISGTLNPIRTNGTKSISCHSLINVDVQDQLERFWNVEECSVERFYSKEETECEKDFVENFTRDKSGRFTARLPLRRVEHKLGDSLEMATKRFLSLEKRLEGNNCLKLEYSNFISEYLDLGHMEKIDLSLDKPNPKNVYYLPHHAVLNDSSITTKLRVVFDASAKTDNGVSLNDILMVGPNLQDELFDILIRFRKHFIAITGDIAKMYRQVLVSEEQRDLQRILWRTDKDSQLEHFRLKTVTYGTGPVSFLATRCLNQIALEKQQTDPRVSKIILKDFYVDDLITGADSIEDAKKIGQRLTEYLAESGFSLRKWASNRKEVLEYLSDSKVDNIGYFITEDDKKKLWEYFGMQGKII